MSNDNNENFSSIAIIGMSGRFPGAQNILEFWQNLCNGKESISFFSDEELLAAGISAEYLNAPNYVKAKGCLEGADLFDAGFFNISPREAEIIDPQQRIFLECCWEAMENSGYVSEEDGHKIGVFAGLSNLETYSYHNLASNTELRKKLGVLEQFLANAADFLSTRVSYKLNLTGPSYDIQTACSTSFVAICQACQNLLSYQCDIALAGAISIFVPLKKGYFTHPGLIISPDGHCRAFDAAAEGTVPGNGVGVVVLKRLQEALQDKDHIYAVIKGFAVNNDGSEKIGIAAPSKEGQAGVIAEALAMADCEPEQISYIEAHGTGTHQGDPIEIAALNQVFSASTDKKQFCAIGSVKTNIGHLEAASGVAGLIKTALALTFKKLPASLHFVKPNPQIDFINSPFFVNTVLREWQRGSEPRRAGISSFGFGGTNTHIILEEAPVIVDSLSARPVHLIILSAKTATALQKTADNLLNYLKENSTINISDVVFTCQRGRKAFPHRMMFTCQNIQDVVNTLQERPPQKIHNAWLDTDKSAEVIFMFSGQGSQHINMAIELYQHEKEFRKHVDICATILEKYLNKDIRSLLFPDLFKTTQFDELSPQDKINQSAITQPALFTIEYALAKLWMSWGVHPAAMIGHSIGEYVAACLAGVFSLEDGLNIVTMRGKLMQSLPAGAMLSVTLDVDSIQPLLNNALTIAAVNSPHHCVVSGTNTAIAELEAKLQLSGIICRQLHTSHAFHSAMMDPILNQFTDYIKKFDFNSPKIPYISNLTGNWIKAEEATSADYWTQHLRQTVQFADGIKLLAEKPRVFLEIGPGRNLVALAQKQLHVAEGFILLHSLPHVDMVINDHIWLFTTFGKLWLAGVNISWKTFNSGHQGKRIPLPTYPFEHQRYFIESPELAGNKHTVNLHKNPLSDWFYIPSWQYRALTKDSNEAKTVVLFADQEGLAKRLATTLKNQAYNVVTIYSGKKFEKINHEIYYLNSGNPQDYDNLFSELFQKPEIPDTLLYLWPITQNCSNTFDLHNLQLEQFFYGLIYLAQALGKFYITKNIQLLVVSNGLHQINSSEKLDPTKSTLLGPTQIIPKEYFNVTCRSIDVILPQTEHEAPWQLLCQQIIAEIRTKSNDPIIAYRHQCRWSRYFEHMYLEKTDVTPEILRLHGVYLITGGLGGIGLTLAEYLAVTYQANLVLIQRTNFPTWENWQEWLNTHDPKDPISAKIHKLMLMEKQGAKVLIIKADVTNQTQMQIAMETIKKKFLKINGVIHAAGIPAIGLLQQKSWDILANTLAPKVKGTIILHQLLQGEMLDFMLLCSSLATIIPFAGQSDYSAANAFLDAFAKWRTGQGYGMTIAINWDIWKEVGMAVNTMTDKTYLEEGLTSQQGITIFNQALVRHFPQLIVSTNNLTLRLTIAEKLIIHEGEKELPTTVKFDVVSTDEIEQNVLKIWQDYLRAESIKLDDDFFDLGGDSLLAIQLSAELASAFDVAIFPHNLIQARTVREIALLIKNLKIAIENPTISSVSKLPFSLVHLRSGQSITNLFLVHPIGGTIYVFHDLVEYLNPKLSIYALQSQALDGVSDPNKTVEQMAKEYLQAIATVQPEGPYWLAGASFGGVIAYEMTRQLHSVKQDIAMLAMFDTAFPSQIQTGLYDDAMIMSFLLHAENGLKVDPDWLRQLTGDERISYFIEHSHFFHDNSTSFTVSQLNFYIQIFKANFKAMQSYKPRPLSNKLEIQYFLATDRDEDYINPVHPDTGWQHLLNNGIHVYKINGSHTSILRKPQVELIAKTINKISQIPMLKKGD